MSERISKYNASGCKDATAYEAISHIDAEEHEIQKRAGKVIKIIKRMVELTDFELITRIQIRDKKTGKEFR